MIRTTPAQERYTRILIPTSMRARCNRPSEDTIAHRSWTGKSRHIDRLHCTTCERELSARAETLIAWSKVPAETVERLMSNVEETGETMRTKA
jgi:hypothetical protein